jgi:SAM-dependent methyltransferase
MAFTEDQKNHTIKLLKVQQRDSGTRTMVLDDKTGLSFELLIEKGVFYSDLMVSGINFSKFLYANQELYAGKEVIDMGCGPGTQGMIMSIYGAKSVVLSDISPKAVINAIKNVKQKNLANVDVYESDLFDGLPKDKTYEVIVFNHPFFSGDPENFEGDPNNDEMLRRSMLGGTELIKKFFSEVLNYLSKDGIIVMPYFHYAGLENDPATHVNDYNLTISKKYELESSEGSELGGFSVYVISKS